MTDPIRPPFPGGDGSHLDDATLQLAAEGLLDDDRRDAVDAHLAACPRCAAEQAAYAALVLQLNAVPVAEAPAALAAAVMAAYTRTAEPVYTLWSDRKLLIAAALTNVLLVIGVLATIGPRNPLTLIGDWAIAVKNAALTALSLLPVAEAVWTAMAHGGIAVVAAVALMLMATVAALRQTLRTIEDMP